METSAAGCGCGIHAWHPRRASARRILRSRFDLPGIVEADGAVEVHEDGFRASLDKLLDLLDPASFKQIHRSTIVNMKAIAAVTRDDSGRGTIRLKTRPETLPVSLTFMPVFKGM